MGFYLLYLNTNQLFLLKYYCIHRIADGEIKDLSSICFGTALFFNREDVAHECLNLYHITVNPEPHSPDKVFKMSLCVSNHQQGLVLHHFIPKTIPLAIHASGACEERDIQFRRPLKQI